MNFQNMFNSVLNSAEVKVFSEMPCELSIAKVLIQSHIDDCNNEDEATIFCDDATEKVRAVFIKKKFGTNILYCSPKLYQEIKDHELKVH